MLDLTLGEKFDSFVLFKDGVCTWWLSDQRLKEIILLTACGNGASALRRARLWSRKNSCQGPRKAGQELTTRVHEGGWQWDCYMFIVVDYTAVCICQSQQKLNVHFKSSVLPGVHFIPINWIPLKCISIPSHRYPRAEHLGRATKAASVRGPAFLLLPLM